MPKGKPGSGDAQQPRGFQVRRAANRPGWEVRQGPNWRFCADLTIQVTVASQDLAGEGACLVGVGVVRTLQRGAILITA